MSPPAATRRSSAVSVRLSRSNNAEQHHVSSVNKRESNQTKKRRKHRSVVKSNSGEQQHPSQAHEPRARSSRPVLALTGTFSSPVGSSCSRSLSSRQQRSATMRCATSNASTASTFYEPPIDSCCVSGAKASCRVFAAGDVRSSRVKPIRWLIWSCVRRSCSHVMLDVNTSCGRDCTSTSLMRSMPTGRIRKVAISTLTLTSNSLRCGKLDQLERSVTSARNQPHLQQPPPQSQQHNRRIAQCRHHTPHQPPLPLHRPLLLHGSSCSHAWRPSLLHI